MARQGLAHRLYTGEISYDFLGRRRIWYAISGVLLLIALAALLLRGLTLGIEFKGGADFQVDMPVTAETVGEVRQAVERTDLPDMDAATIRTMGDQQVRVQTRSLQPDEITTVRAALAKQANTTPDKVAYALVGASWGQQITSKAVLALVVFLVLVMAMIWIYFHDLKMSIAAIVALLHDLLLTVGIYALVGFTVTPATLIGVLTILGYSLYDTVVVFDKVRENVADLRNGRRTYTEAANHAVNQVLVRSINTTIIGVLPVAAILVAGVFILGSGPLQDLGLALFVGMVAGAYSSVFIATPLLAQLKEAEPAMQEHRARLARRSARRAPAVSAVGGAAAASQPSPMRQAGATIASGPAQPAAAGATAVPRDARPGERRQPQHRPRSDRKK